MTNVSLYAIQIPPEPDWTSKKDTEYIKDTLSDDYEFNDLLLRCFELLREMSAALRQALVFLGKNAEQLGASDVHELIYRVETRIRERAPSNEYLDRFVEHLTRCRFAATEFERVIGVYGANPDIEWLAPLADLGDKLGRAKMDFEEGMICEHDNFDRQRTKEI